MPQNKSKKKIIYIQYTDPAYYPPLAHSSKILADSGMEILFLGSHVFGDRNTSFVSHSGISLKLLPCYGSGWLLKLHYLLFFLWGVFWGAMLRPDWIYASDLWACPSVYILKKFFCLKVIYHEHDTPNITNREERSIFLKIVLWFRKKLAKKADLCVLPNKERLDYFIKTTGRAKEVIEVWNCPMREEVPTEPSGAKKNGLQIVYCGSIVSDRLPIAVIKALSLLPDNVKLTIVGYETIGSIGYVETLLNEAKKLGLEKRVEFVGRIMNRYELYGFLGNKDVGLSFIINSVDDVNMQYMVGASNKPFEYLACGMPLLIADLPDWEKMYADQGYCKSCDPKDSANIAKTLCWFLEHPEERRVMGERGRQKILDEWNYEKQFAPVMDYITRHIK